MSLSKSARNSDEQLFALLDKIVGRGDEPSVRTLHKAAGGGSYARLRKVFELWEKDQRQLVCGNRKRPSTGKEFAVHCRGGPDR